MAWRMATAEALTVSSRGIVLWSEGQQIPQAAEGGVVTRNDGGLEGPGNLEAGVLPVAPQLGGGIPQGAGAHEKGERFQPVDAVGESGRGHDGRGAGAAHFDKRGPAESRRAGPNV